MARPSPATRGSVPARTKLLIRAGDTRRRCPASSGVYATGRPPGTACLIEPWSHLRPLGSPRPSLQPFTASSAMISRSRREATAKSRSSSTGPSVPMSPRRHLRAGETPKWILGDKTFRGAPGRERPETTDEARDRRWREPGLLERDDERPPRRRSPHSAPGRRRGSSGRRRTARRSCDTSRASWATGLALNDSGDHELSECLHAGRRFHARTTGSGGLIRPLLPDGVVWLARKDSNLRSPDPEDSRRFCRSSVRFERGADSDAVDPAGNQVEHAGRSQVNVNSFK
jgi:hypothetical protein